MNKLKPCEHCACENHTEWVEKQNEYLCEQCKEVMESVDPIHEYKAYKFLGLTEWGH